MWFSNHIERKNEGDFAVKALSSNSNKFTILNITDTHASLACFRDSDDKTGRALKHTVGELVKRSSPDLITVTGDMTSEDDREIYRLLCEYIDSFGIPWAPVMGNHDNQLGDEESEAIGKIMSGFGGCLFEVGPKGLGYGNYTLCTDDTGLIFMDTHSMFNLFYEGRERSSWGEVTEAQTLWYRDEVSRLKSRGINKSILFVHIPLYEYKLAASEIFTRPLEEIEGLEGKPIDCPAEFIKIPNFFRFGANYEEPSSPLCGNGFFDIIVEEGHTTHVICGHNHVNCSSVMHRGVCLTYGLKTGIGSYGVEHLNGGTVITLESGNIDIRHEFVELN